MEQHFEKLNKVYLAKLKEVEKYKFKRYIYSELLKLVKEKRMIALLKGVRGCGKTTILLQLANELLERKKKVFYFSADHFIFSSIKLFDFIEFLFENKGYEYIFIDEIHRYNNWATELKNAFDSFNLFVLASGSNSAEIAKGKQDLSRRAIEIPMAVLSLREYLSIKHKKELPKVSLQDIVNNFHTLPKKLIYEDLGYYLNYGALPLFHEYSAETLEKMYVNILRRILDEDMLSFNFTSEVLMHARNVLAYIALNPPGEISISSIAEKVGLSKGAVSSLLNALEDCGVIYQLKHAKKGKKLLMLQRKILVAPPFRSILCRELATQPNIGSLREDFFVTSVQHLKPKYFMHKDDPDFKVGKYFFEIGGKSKKIAKHLKKKILLVKDVSFSLEEIPLFLFGYLF